MFTRRNFLQASLSAVPTLSALGKLPDSPIPAATTALAQVRFTGDGPMYSPDLYIAKLQEINQVQPIERDVYGKGGCIDQLTKKFAEITGKEAAIYMPSGTLANQLAISVLSGENTKVFVQDTSHVYRDEADAAQSVFDKRLIPLAPGKAYFTLEELQHSLDELNKGEVFRSGYGAVSIENPVRRCDGQVFPIGEIKKIAAFCREKGYKLHLDGARLYLAAAYTGISIAEYASYFDTVYISLYKYLGAAGGAILCGPKAIIDRMEHLVKIHGGVVFMSWANAAMALHHLTGLEDRMQRTATQSKQLFTLLNQLPDLKITPITEGTNIANVQFAPAVNAKKLTELLNQKYNISLGRITDNGAMKLMVNDSLLTRTNEQLLAAFQEAIAVAKS